MTAEKEPEDPNELDLQEVYDAFSDACDIDGFSAKAFVRHLAKQGLCIVRLERLPTEIPTRNGFYYGKVKGVTMSIQPIRVIYHTTTDKLGTLEEGLKARTTWNWYSLNQIDWYGPVPIVTKDKGSDPNAKDS